ncbi:hypothetical protein CR513_14481, partial [Mucuna pruriens]
MLGLDCIKKLYEKNLDFSEPFAMCVHLAFNDFFRHDSFLFKKKRLCVLLSFIRRHMKVDLWVTLENLRLWKF